MGLLIKLPKKFKGRGETKGFRFLQLKETAAGYLYQVTSGDYVYYEVFKKVELPVCLDFAKHIYSETDFKENYPKKNAFGVSAWTTPSLKRANKILKTFKVKEDED